MATIGTTTRTPYQSTTGSPSTATSNSWARWLNIALGVWLFISAWVWPHTTSSATNTWIVGLLIVAAGIIAMYVPWFRWVNTALAIWLFFSTFAFPHVTSGTMWNNAIVAIIVFIVSLIPGQVRTTSGRQTLAAAT